MKINKEIPKTIPVAKKATAIRAGVKIPKPLMPITCLAAATKEATNGNIKIKTNVFGGTP